MARYVALMRGINVGGKRIIPMSTLGEAFRSMGFVDVRTYIQSGNVMFGSDAVPDDSWEAAIEQMLEKTFSHQIPTVLRAQSDLLHMVQEDPFPDVQRETIYKAVAFLKTLPEQHSLDRLQEIGGDSEHYQLVGRDLLCYLSYERGKLDKTGMGKLEKILGVQVTVRNWKTVTRLSTL